MVYPKTFYMGTFTCLLIKGKAYMDASNSDFDVIKAKFA